jgi:hypothetical protein
MSFWITHWWGAQEHEPALERLDELYAELLVADAEHPDVAVQHESGWCLSAFGSGLLVWENVENGEPAHLRGVAREKTLELWRALARGDIAAIQQERWQPGYGS